MVAKHSGPKNWEYLSRSLGPVYWPVPKWVCPNECSNIICTPFLDGLQPIYTPFNGDVDSIQVSYVSSYYLLLYDFLNEGQRPKRTEPYLIPQSRIHWSHGHGPQNE